MRFNNRADAGRQLAARLTAYAGRSDAIVLALPRGGVPVGYEVAERLRLPLDVFLVRKLGVPGHAELAMGAIAEGGVEVLSEDLIRDVGISRALVQQVAVRERLELERRDKLYRGGRSLAPVKGHLVILVDDGLATGSSMQAAVVALKRLEPARIVVAVPVGARETCLRLGRVADEIVCPEMPEPFQAVGLWYRDFSQTTDDEVRRLLELARRGGQQGNGHAAPPSNPVDAIRAAAGGRDISIRTVTAGGPLMTGGRGAFGTTAVHVPIGALFLDGDLGRPPRASGLVLFAHGSGSSRHSSRNKYVARTLERRGFATLLVDLLTQDEEAIDQRTAHLRFDIGMLAERLAAIIDWLGRRGETAGLPVGLFGASTGGGAALVAAAARPRQVGAVVSRGGRPDLAGPALPHVIAPTLLIVGGRDTPVITMNQDAMARMRCEVALEIAPGATHLFEERGALERVAELAAGWFGRHLHGRNAAERAAG